MRKGRKFGRKKWSRGSAADVKQAVGVPTFFQLDSSQFFFSVLEV